MASMSPCTIEPDVIDRMKKFRRESNKSSMSILLRCDTKTNQVVVEKELKNVSVEDLVEELPSREPRFILNSHELKHDDGRIQYPLNMILYIPCGCGTNSRFTYASTAKAVSAASGITRIIEFREEISAEWLKKELNKVY